MRILLAEDNVNHGTALFGALSRIGEIAWLTTERQFIEAWPRIVEEPPDIAVIDMMLPWDEPRRDPIPPPEGWGMHDAGLRCARRFLEISPAPPPFVIVYSVMEPPELPPNARFVRKEDDLVGIIRAIASGLFS